MADFVVGLTGGVASGKSEATRRFEALGVIVADADIAAREAVALGSEGLARVVATFGDDVLDADGALDRVAMRKRIYLDPAARKRLETIIHPRVRRALRAQCAAAPGPYAIAAIPLLAEASADRSREGSRMVYPWLDRIAVVDVSIELQFTRLVARDGIDAALANRMIEAQATRAQRLAIADDVIDNTGTLAELQAQVEALDANYRALASV